jgi:hypothetical protein
VEIIKALTSITGFFHPVDDEEGKIPGYGSERVWNGSFDPIGGWVLGVGWVIGGGVLNDNGANGTFCRQVLVLVVGVRYRVKFRVSNFVSGIFQCYIGSGGGLGVIVDGYYSFDYIHAGVDNNIYLQNSADSDLDIDDVSVREIIIKDE